MKKILIIGGMGPQASITLHRKIIDKAVDNGALEGHDFPLITHVSIPVPEFLQSKSDSNKELSVIKEHLYSLWQARFHSYSHCM